MRSFEDAPRHSIVDARVRGDDGTSKVRFWEGCGETSEPVPAAFARARVAFVLETRLEGAVKVVVFFLLLRNVGKLGFQGSHARVLCLELPPQSSLGTTPTRTRTQAAKLGTAGGNTVRVRAHSVPTSCCAAVATWCAH